MHIMYSNVAFLIHVCCTFFIISGLKSKPLGAQTLVDLVMTNTLVVQCIHIFGHILVLNWSFSMNSPRNDTICIIFTIVIIYSALFHALFLLLNVLTKYIFEFTFIHDFQSMNTYKALKVSLFLFYSAWA